MGTLLLCDGVCVCLLEQLHTLLLLYNILASPSIQEAAKANIEKESAFPLTEILDDRARRLVTLVLTFEQLIRFYLKYI